jgi:hypothetical protein
MDGEGLVAYEGVNELLADGKEQIQRALAGHNIIRYPEGAYVASFAPPNMETSGVRDPEEIISEPHPVNIELGEFPPEEGQLCHW